MISYIFRRLLQMIPLLLGITFVTFAIINAAGNPINRLLFDPRIKPEDRERLTRNLGLDKPWFERYFIWLGNVLQGDLGISLINSSSVTQRILNVLPNTLLLSGLAILFSLAVALPLGIYAAVHRNSAADRFIQFFSVAAFAIPTVWLGLLLIILFSVKFREWGLPALPVGGMYDVRDGGGLKDRVVHMILPVLALSLPQVAGWTIYIRSSMLEVIRQDYVLTANAKGLGRRTVIFFHAFRNALLPLITLIGFSLPDLFGGSLVVENVFAWNGMGRLAFGAVGQKDYTMIMGTTLMFSMLIIIGNLVADVLYAIADPRIRLN